MRYFLGIDDTDGPGSWNTSLLALQLGLHIEKMTPARLIDISCHQLIQRPSVQSTTYNIACCLVLEAEPISFRDIDLVTREFMRRECAPKSNPGFALSPFVPFDPRIVRWGIAAKYDRVDRSDAISLGKRCMISIAGFCGNGAGVIGALAAVGLRFQGSDGWLSWMPALHSLQGTMTPLELEQDPF